MPALKKTLSLTLMITCAVARVDWKRSDRKEVGKSIRGRREVEPVKPFPNISVSFNYTNLRMRSSSAVATRSIGYYCGTTVVEESVKIHRKNGIRGYIPRNAFFTWSSFSS